MIYTTENARHVLGTGQVVREISPHDFRSGGDFDRVHERLTGQEFDDLVAEECTRVSHYLDEWQRQLHKVDKASVMREMGDLRTAFRDMSTYSGVLYLSDNLVLSEAIFDNAAEGQAHLTSRSVHPVVKRKLPWTDRLTFSFPRKYNFFGFWNSWGFVRFPEVNKDRQDRAILSSCTTLDPQILKLLEKTGMEDLALQYNRVWRGAIHDYLHHVVMYTNPSFGIGRRSPMSLAGANEPVDDWGQRMMSTFNYEYWAHRSHRLITAALMTPETEETSLGWAMEYLEGVFEFSRRLFASGESADLADRAAAYLVAIYLWPLNILFDPRSAHAAKIRNKLKAAPFPGPVDGWASVATALSRPEYGGEGSNLQGLLSDNPYTLLAGLHTFRIVGDSPHQKTVAARMTLSGFTHQTNPSTPLDWGDWVAMLTEIEGFRGLYEAWFHDEPVRLNGVEVEPHQATLDFISAFAETRKAFACSEPREFALHGIVA